MSDTVMGPRGEQRVMPSMPTDAYITFALRQPAATHFRPAACAEVDCPKRANGWMVRLDTASPAHAEAANWIRLHSGLHFEAVEQGTVVTFTFPPGQSCFDAHRVSLEREALAVRRSGDWRGNPRGDRRVYDRLDQWLDDFGTHQERVADDVRRG